MFRLLILGLLRDGQARHGYGLMTDYRARSGHRLSIGNLYRELARLAAQGLVQSGVNPPDADPRRIPYQITDRGRQLFDQWLVAPLNQDGELSTKIIFMDQIPNPALTRLLDRWQEDMWSRGKALVREREDALAKLTPDALTRPYNPLPALLSRRLKHVTAELEFLEEFRADLDTWVQRSRSATPVKPDASGVGQSSAKRPRQRGTR